MDATTGLEAPAASRRRATPRAALIGCGVALGLVALLALRVGAVPISWHDTIAILASTIGFALPDDVSAQRASVLLAIRLPRVVLGILAGAGLSVAGAVLQAVFRNPLADPALIGVSSGAALAVTATIVLGSMLPGDTLRLVGPYALPLAGFVGGLVATVVLYRVATVAGATSLATMLLAGIAVNALAFAGVGLLMTVASNEQLRNITFWNFGSLGGADWQAVGLVALGVVVATGLLIRMAPGLNALALGDVAARHLGYDTQRLKRGVIGLSALMAGFIVAFCGVIGFVALVAPHVARLLLGPDNRVVIPGSALLGALLLLGADLVGRNVVSPAELPIGIVTALVGAPFFLWLLMRDRRLARQ